MWLCAHGIGLLSLWIRRFLRWLRALAFLMAGCFTRVRDGWIGMAWHGKAGRMMLAARISKPGEVVCIYWF